MNMNTDVVIGRNRTLIVRTSNIIICIITLSLAMYSCSSNSSKDQSAVEDNKQVHETYSPSYHNNASIEQEVSTPNTSSASNQSPTIDAYDEGLLDGEAMAEEDRLVGRPGMQSGMDDDDDEYEDGFDDSYDE